ncbi:MAG: hypothetical protein P8R54_13975 [Myxococcota bacterium]|nr:hypothetical protein [Myxococcota bacterium]
MSRTACGLAVAVQDRYPLDILPLVLLACTASAPISIPFAAVEGPHAIQCGEPAPTGLQVYGLRLFVHDFYYDEGCAAGGGEHLDAHNGHEHDEHGDHYHVTGSFLYTMGPTLCGLIQDATSVNCGGVSAGGGPPPR